MFALTAAPSASFDVGCTEHSAEADLGSTQFVNGDDDDNDNDVDNDDDDDVGDGDGDDVGDGIDNVGCTEY